MKAIMKFVVVFALGVLCGLLVAPIYRVSTPYVGRVNRVGVEGIPPGHMVAAGGYVTSVEKSFVTERYPSLYCFECHARSRKPIVPKVETSTLLEQIREAQQREDETKR